MKVLLFMKGNSAMFLFITLCVVYIICLSIKQNFGNALGKLILFIIFLSIK